MRPIGKSLSSLIICVASPVRACAAGRTPLILDGTGTERMWSDLEIELALPRAMAIEAEIDKNKPPPLNLGSLSGASYKSYPITATPRKELW